MLWHFKTKAFPQYKVSNVIANSLTLASVVMIMWITFGAASAYQRRPCGYLEVSVPYQLHSDVI